MASFRMTVQCDAQQLRKCFERIDTELSNPDLDKEHFIKSCPEFSDIFEDVEKALPGYIETSTTTRPGKVIVSLKPSQRLYDFLSELRKFKR
jgi:hypothetical protein